MRFRLAALPEATRWVQLYGITLLCGIGFTMSMFIASLAGNGVAEVFGIVRLGVLAGTLLSAVAGYLVLRQVLPQDSRQ